MSGLFFATTAYSTGEIAKPLANGALTTAQRNYVNNTVFARMLKGQFENPLLDNLSTAVFFLTEQLDVAYFNPAAEMLLKVSQKRLETSNLLELFNSTENTVLSELTEILKSGQTYTQRESELSLLNGSRILVDCTVSCVSILGESGLMLEMYAKDRLKRISREEQLHENQETAKILIRGLAHEIKNPLGGIRGAAQLLGAELSDPNLNEYTQVIIEEADRLRNLVNRMLGTNKALSVEQLNIHEILERVTSLIDAESGKTIKIVKDYDPSLPNIIGDKSQLIQGFLNIAKNASQALSQQLNQNEEAQITLKTRALRQFTIGQTRFRLAVRIDIMDNGPGIPKELLHSIFYPMISGRAEGTGLGLSITQSIFSRHKGLVECESEPGRTNFIIYLPLEHKE